MTGYATSVAKHQNAVCIIEMEFEKCVLLNLPCIGHKKIPYIAVRCMSQKALPVHK
jgi:hypothetical protein